MLRAAAQQKALLRAKSTCCGSHSCSKRHSHSEPTPKSKDRSLISCSRMRQQCSEPKLHCAAAAHMAAAKGILQSQCFNQRTACAAAVSAGGPQSQNCKKQMAAHMATAKGILLSWHCSTRRTTAACTQNCEEAKTAKLEQRV